MRTSCSLAQITDLDNVLLSVHHIAAILGLEQEQSASIFLRVHFSSEQLLVHFKSTFGFTNVLALAFVVASGQHALC